MLTRLLLGHGSNFLRIWQKHCRLAIFLCKESEFLDLTKFQDRVKCIVPIGKGEMLVARKFRRLENRGEIVAHNALTCSVVLLISILALSGIAIGESPDDVYNNTTTFTSGPTVPNGFWPFNVFWPNEPMGDQITLTGVNRTVVEFDLILSSSAPVTLADLTLAFHEVEYPYPNNPNIPYPGDEIWSTAINNVPVDGVTTITFPVPNVEVPDTFVWVAGADSDVAGLATCDPPTRGSSDDFYWDHDTFGDVWYSLYFNNDPVANFGAKVVAVPEPTITGFLALGSLLVAWKKKQ